MKIKAFATISLLLLLGLVAPRIASAQASSGSYKFEFEDGYSKSADFDARGQADGSATGSLLFSDDAPLYLQDVDGTGDPSQQGKYPGYTMKVDFDGLTVDKNQAVMSGTVTDSSITDMIGRRVLLTVEDNGDNTRVPDKLTWGIYTPVQRTWTPTDAERKDDDGASLRWIATDAERRDDQGIPMPRDESITTKSFPISSYNFADIAAGGGDILVQP
jgi:hypothetical protein